MRAHIRLRFTTKLQRKDPSLPVYAVLPAGLLKEWDLSGTTVVEGTAKDNDIGRRNIKAWGKGSNDWFIEFTAPFCAKASLAVGDEFKLELALADTSPPEELQALLASKTHAKTWAALTDKQQREAAEYVRAAKTQLTRERRAKKVLGSLK